MDNLPLTVSNVSVQINGIGSCMASLNLQPQLSLSVQRDMIAAVEPWKSVLWILQDNFPVWCGPITSWVPTNGLDGTLPFQAATFETMAQYRQISTNLTFTGMDVFDIFRALGTYATSKPNGQIASFQTASNESGITDTLAFDGSQYQTIYDVWNAMVTAYNIEYTFRAGFTDAGNLGVFLTLGYPQLGRPYSSTNLNLTFPSQGIIDYQYQRQASSPANTIVITGATANGTTTFTSQSPHGVETDELSQGYPLLEGSATMPVPVTTQAQVNAYADGYITSTSILSQVTPVIVMGPDFFPRVREFQLGDECYFVATSPLHPADENTGAPGLQMKARIIGWTLYPPSAGNPEKTWINLGALTQL
jgi:hypothetical protein